MPSWLRLKMLLCTNWRNPTSSTFLCLHFHTCVVFSSYRKITTDVILPRSRSQELTFPVGLCSIHKPLKIFLNLDPVPFSPVNSSPTVNTVYVGLSLFGGSRCSVSQRILKFFFIWGVIFCEIRKIFLKFERNYPTQLSRMHELVRKITTILCTRARAAAPSAKMVSCGEMPFFEIQPLKTTKRVKGVCF